MCINSGDDGSNKISFVLFLTSGPKFIELVYRITTVLIIIWIYKTKT